MPSGPVPYTIELSPGLSVAAFRLWNGGTRKVPQNGLVPSCFDLRNHPAVPFICCLCHSRMVLGVLPPWHELPAPAPPHSHWSPHERLAFLLSHHPVDDHRLLLAGTVIRNPDDPDVLVTDDFTGHFWENWREANVRKFRAFVESLGFASSHPD